ncbi:MAG TPA: hypothetical protein VGL40_00770, partial [Bacillota bacterium]
MMTFSRRRLLTLAVLALFAAVAIGPRAAWAATAVLPGVLLSAPPDYDGREVTFEAEVLDPVLPRGDYSWVNVLDENGVAIGLWMPSDLARRITTTGRYGRMGDTVAVSGTFRAACGQHDGEADVHVQSLEVIARGHATEPPAAAHRWPIALGLVG